MLLVTVKDSRGGQFTLHVARNASVRDLKREVIEASVVGNAQVRLVLRGKQLVHDDAILHDLVPQGEALLLIHMIVGRATSHIPVRVNVVWGQETGVVLNLSDRVYRIKEIMFERSGVRPEAQILIFRGKHLCDEQLIRALCIRDSEVVHLVDKGARQRRIASVTASLTAAAITASAVVVEPNDSQS